MSPLNSFPSPLVLSPLEESHYARPTSKEFGVRPSCEGHSTFVKYLEFYMGGLPLLPNLSIYLYQYRIMDIYSILRLIIQCSFLALLIKRFQVWPLGTLENPGSLSHTSIHFFSFSGTAEFSRLILCISHQNPGISHLSGAILPLTGE